MSNSEGPIEVKVEIEKCIGAGQCVRAAPTVFAQNEDDGLVYLLQDHVAPGLREAVNTAAKWCPARAIFIEEAQKAKPKDGAA